MPQPTEPTSDEEGLLDGTTTIPEFASLRGFTGLDSLPEFTSDEEGLLDSTTDLATIHKLRPVPVQQTSSSPFRFLSLPSELRNKIYKLILVSNSPIEVGACSAMSPSPMYREPLDWDWSWPRSTSMLLVSRQIYHEAEAILYSHNFFVMYSPRLDLLECFLNHIGPVKASLLSHLYINYPIMETFPHCRPGEVKLQRDGLRSLRLLQQKCTNLRKLTLGEFVKIPFVGFLDNLCVHVVNSVNIRPILHEYFVRVNTELQAITSLAEVTVHLPGLNSIDILLREALEEAMREFGWVLGRPETS